MERRIFKMLSSLLWTTVFLGFQSCSDSKDLYEINTITLTDYVWEWDGDSEYWIDPSVGGVERDVESSIYYFLDSTHGIKCRRHYNFDYVGGSHSINRKGYAFTYATNSNEIVLYFEDSREDMQITSGGLSLTDAHGDKIARRSYNSDDQKFLDEWLPFCWPELCGNGSGNGETGNDSSGNGGNQVNTSPFDFKVEASTVQAFLEGAYTRKWVVWLSFATNNLSKHNVSSFQLDVKALNGKITNKKEYGTVNVYPNFNSVSLLVTGLQNITNNNLIQWDACLFITTYGEEELRLEFTPSWINGAGTYEGDVVFKTYKPTHIIESE